ncbi:MAG: response regulator [Dehalococcoidia bacterium]|nr:MAG: response regulator [Dehalococcoidia bacterium]
MKEKKVLIVEDEETIRRLFKDVLEKVGYKIIIAGDGEQGVQLASKEKPDLILMDVQMPIKNGLEATKEIKGNPLTNNIPVVALTALAMKGDEERVRAAGCDDYISKPVQIRALLEKVASYFK